MSCRRAFAAVIVAGIMIAVLAASAFDGYYLQSVGGQLEILRKSRPIATVVRDERVPAEVRERLHLVVEIRDFAVRELGLPDSGSFRRYADLGREYVVWNVFAAPALSVEPVRWCFPVAGCVPYRGYFDRERAKAYAGEWEARGYDVHVGGVRAYSTLGWLRDPVLNTFLHLPEPALAAKIFHELAHELYYLAGDAVFNESFATAVENEGLRRWLAARGEPEAFGRHMQQRERGAVVIAVSLGYRDRLAALYADDLGREEKLERKAGVLAELSRDYERLEVRRDANNARLAVTGAYHGLVPAFDALLAEHAGDLPAFYRAVRSLGELPRAQRMKRLAALVATHGNAVVNSSADSSSSPEDG